MLAVRPGRVRTTLVLTLVLSLAAGGPLAPTAGRAADDKQLARVKGTVGYQPAAGAPFTFVAGKFVLPDDYFAVTRAASAALVVLPDSSLVSLGQDTSVQVGAFNRAVAGPGATIAVNGGTLRFDIRRPQGGVADYRFTTATTQIAVRGTIGLISFLNGVTTVACIVCAADSVLVTVVGAAAPLALASGAVLTISATGSVVTGTLAGATATGFTAGGVSTSAGSGVGGALAGVGSLPATAALGAGTTGLVAAGAVAAAAAGVAASNSTSAQAPRIPSLPTGQPTASPSPSPSPTGPSATPTQGGTISINGKRAPAALPAAAPPTLPPTRGRR